PVSSLDLVVFSLRFFGKGVEDMSRKVSNSKRSAGTNGAAATLPLISEQSVRDLAQVFKLLSDETRMRILVFLAQNQELHVTDLCSRLGQSQPAVSHHLALLRVSGLIESRREGKHNFYSVRSDFFGEMLVDLLSTTGDMPRRIKFHDFTLTYEGE
ncbi:MAG TPA: metalloregulator ArsR/SmtB family transcription factor, partial [Isosphaeraceae bacterium]|nr:metalloregulator ArsR/SmtB family transcription factor [Isosphaeraceae bacterium]